MSVGKRLNDDDVRDIYRRISNWKRWGAEDERGALNYITAEHCRKASALIKEGLSISCASPVDTIPSPTNIFPAQHYLTMAGDVAPTKGPSFTYDYIGVFSHGPSQTHIDALCHVADSGKMFNGHPASAVQSTGAKHLAVTTGRDGIVSRGVLLDIAGSRGVDFIEAEDPIRPDDFLAAEKKAGVQVSQGDILIYRTGRHQRRAKKGPFAERLDGKTYLAGIYPDCLEWIGDRKVALLGSDSAHDVLPAPFPEEQFPIHVGAQVYMGVQLLHNLQLDRLLKHCQETRRWEFFFSVQPLYIIGGTASPVNPIAIF